MRCLGAPKTEQSLGEQRTVTTTGLGIVKKSLDDIVEVTGRSKVYKGVTLNGR